MLHFFVWIDNANLHYIPVPVALKPDLRPVGFGSFFYARLILSNVLISNYLIIQLVRAFYMRSRQKNLAPHSFPGDLSLSDCFYGCLINFMRQFGHFPA
jgi:hypothetical protein